MTPEIAKLAQIGLKSEGFDPGPIDGLWGARSMAAFESWRLTKNAGPSGTTPPWLAIARKEMGVVEIPGTSHNPRILEYHARTKLAATADETAWCSSFAGWCMEEAGKSSPRSAWARDWLNYGMKCDLRVGAVVVFRRGNGGHVGFAERWDSSQIWVLGGNQSNRVSIAPYPRSNFLGCRWPTS